LARGALDRVLGLCARKRWFNISANTRNRYKFFFFIRTASTEELREHVEGVGVFVLAAFVGLQTLFAMTVVYLSFLSSLSVSAHTLSKVLSVYVPLNQRGSHMLMKSVRSNARTTELSHDSDVPCATSTNLLSASGSWFLSGWYLRLRRLYAFLTSCSDADLSTV
jgi:hypothetical protein